MTEDEQSKAYLEIAGKLDRIVLAGSKEDAELALSAGSLLSKLWLSMRLRSIGRSVSTGKVLKDLEWVKAWGERALPMSDGESMMAMKRVSACITSLETNEQ